MKQLKKALKTIIKVVEKTDSAYEDKHISFVEWGGIAYSSLGLVRVIKSIKSLIEEYNNLTDPARVELAAWFKEEFDIINDDVEKIVEDIFATLLRLGGIFEQLKK